jgi:hypothetical protein
MPNGVTAGSRSDTSRPGLKQIFGCRFEKLRPCGAVQPRQKFFQLEKYRHAVVNAAGELGGCGHDQHAAALTVVGPRRDNKGLRSDGGRLLRRRHRLYRRSGSRAARLRLRRGTAGAPYWSAWFEQRYLFRSRIPQARDSPVAMHSPTTSRRCCVRCRLGVCQLGHCTLIPGRLRWPGTFLRLAAP